MTVCGSVAFAQNDTKAQNAATETWTVTSGTRISKQNTEYPYYASANVTIMVGANETWETPVQKGEKWYLASQGNPQFGDKNDAELKDGKGEPNCIAMPDEGNYFHFLFHTKGKITLNYATFLKIRQATSTYM